MFRRKPRAVQDEQPTPADNGINEFVHMSFSAKENAMPSEEEEEERMMNKRTNVAEMDFEFEGERYGGAPLLDRDQIGYYAETDDKAAMRGRSLIKDPDEVPKKKRSKSKKKKKAKKKKKKAKKKKQSEAEANGAVVSEVEESDWETDGEGAGEVTDAEEEYFAPKTETPVVNNPDDPMVTAAADYLSDDSLELMVEERSRYSRYTTVDDDEYENIPGDDRYAAGASQNRWEEESNDDSAPARWRSFDETEQMEDRQQPPTPIIVPKVDALKDLRSSEQKLASAISPRVEALLGGADFDFEKPGQKPVMKRASKRKEKAAVGEVVEKALVPKGDEQDANEKEGPTIQKIPSDTSSLTDPMIQSKKPSVPHLHRAKPEDFQTGRKNTVEVGPPEIVQTGPSNSLDDTKGSLNSGSKTKSIGSQQRSHNFMSTLSPVIIGASFDDEARKPNRRRFMFGSGGSKSKESLDSTLKSKETANRVPATEPKKAVTAEKSSLPPPPPARTSEVPKAIEKTAPSTSENVEKKEKVEEPQPQTKDESSSKGSSSKGSRKVKRTASKSKKGMGFIKGLQVLSPIRKRPTEEKLFENKEDEKEIAKAPKEEAQKEIPSLVVESRDETEPRTEPPTQDKNASQQSAMYTKSLLGDDSASSSSRPSVPVAREGPPALKYSPKRGRSPKVATSPRERLEKSLSPRQSEIPLELDEFDVSAQVQQQSALVQCLNFYNLSSAAKVAGVLISATDCRTGMPAEESFEVQMLGAEKNKDDKKEALEESRKLKEESVPVVVSPKVEMVLELDASPQITPEEALRPMTMKPTEVPDPTPVVSEDSVESAPVLGRNRSRVREVSSLRLHLDGDTQSDDKKSGRLRKNSANVSVTSIQFKAKQATAKNDEDSDGSSTDVGIATPAADDNAAKEEDNNKPKKGRRGFLKMFQRKARADKKLAEKPTQESSPETMDKYHQAQEPTTSAPVSLGTTAAE